jgi:hypothetical protein
MHSFWFSSYTKREHIALSMLQYTARKYYRRQYTFKSFRLISLTLIGDFWKPYLITNMFLLLIGLLSTVLSYDIFRKSDQFCPYDGNTFLISYTLSIYIMLIYVSIYIMLIYVSIYIMLIYVPLICLYLVL